MTIESPELRTAALQPRAQARVQAIREAALAHYNAVGRDKFNTAAVAAAAGCSIGTIYRYFANRIALMNDIAPDRDQVAPADKPLIPEKIEVVVEKVPQDVQDRLDSAAKTLAEMRAWGQQLADKGEGKGNLKVAGEALLNLMTERGW
jgi:hypothetical protein